jgi:hypothetical protein
MAFTFEYPNRFDHLLFYHLSGKQVNYRLDIDRQITPAQAFNTIKLYPLNPRV